MYYVYIIFVYNLHYHYFLIIIFIIVLMLLQNLISPEHKQVFVYKLFINNNNKVNSIFLKDV